MAKGINKVTLIGNLGADPETRYMPNGNAVTNVRLATSDSWRDRQTGEQQERTEWHRVVLFGRLGEIAAEYLRKGSQVYLEGRLQTRKWQAQDGTERWSTEIIANEMQMLGSRRQQSTDYPESHGDPGADWERAPAPPPASSSYGGNAPAKSAAAPPTASSASEAPKPNPASADPSDNFDDDIPF